MGASTYRVIKASPSDPDSFIVCEITTKESFLLKKIDMTHNTKKSMSYLSCA